MKDIITGAFDLNLAKVPKRKRIWEKLISCMKKAKCYADLTPVEKVVKS
jgi:hypothetical protein